jgi:hypothetical protein
MDAGKLPVVLVRVGPTTDDGRVKVAWFLNEQVDTAYDISSSTLIERAKEVRKLLATMATNAAEGRMADQASTLRDLAIAGARLRNALFHSTPNRDPGTEIKEWLTSLPIPHRISFIDQGGIRVPWGLIYEGDPAKFPDESLAAANVACDGFWALRYHVTAPPRIGVRKYELSGENFELIPVVHPDVHKDTEVVRKTDEYDDFEQRVIHSLLHTPLLGKQALHGAWPRFASKDGLLYVLCHADGTALSFGKADADRLTFHDFKDDFPRYDKKSLILIFLNGCSTAFDRLDKEGWLSVGSNQGFVGIIGTEAVIPDVFAMRFGLAFLAAFLGRGDSVLATIDELRRLHLPLSLIYSVHCPGTLRINPPFRPEELRPSPKPENLSLRKVGTNYL